MLLVWARGDSIFGLFTVPALAGGVWRDQALELHGAIATAILVLAGLHASAALVHRYVWHDGVLARMLPDRSAGGGRP